MMLPQKNETSTMMNDNDMQDYDYEGYEDGTNVLESTSAYTTNIDKGGYFILF